MSVLGYSELLKEIYGITPESLENEISKLLTSKPSPAKVHLLKHLAKTQRATVSELLRALKMPNTGGSFKSIKKFFIDLTKFNILVEERVGKRTYYSFSKDSDLSKWLA